MGKGQPEARLTGEDTDMKDRRKPEHHFTGRINVYMARLLSWITLSAFGLTLILLIITLAGQQP